MAARFDAVLLDAGGVLVIPDPVAIGGALEPILGHHPIGHFHRAHHAGLFALESDAFEAESRTIETLDWSRYRNGYVAALGAQDDTIEAAADALRRVWSSLLWRFRIEENVAALWHLAHHRQVPTGIVSNATGQIEAVLRYEGVCQVGVGAGTPVRCIIDSHVVGVAKPDPGIFAGAFAALGDIDPARIAYIGDSFINDVEGARAAGLVPLHLDPFDDYAALGHERIRSVHDVLAFV
jgi:putative hydrolase of the HAD superfamily